MKRKIIYLVLILFIITISISVSAINSSKKIELIQLSPQTSTQMMGYIIKTKNDQIIVIDGGTTSDIDNFMNYIKEYNNKVDYWFLTHIHHDHAGVFVEAVDRGVQIENIYVSVNEKEWYEKNEPDRAEFSSLVIDTLNKNEIKNKVKSPNVNDVIYIDGIRTEILGIKNPEFTENSGNEQSMVIKFNTEKTSILFLGDTGFKSSEKLLKTQKEKLQSDIVQMAHHGQNAASKELYKTINPKICLWPTPEWLWNNDSGEGINSGSWKIGETKKWLNEMDIKQNYIAKDGDIKIEIK